MTMAAPRGFRLLHTCLCYFFTHLILTNGINLDARFSVIKKGLNSTYFGFSVAQHQVLNDETGELVENVLLIGAPKEIRRLGNSDVGGALYRCNALDSNENSCEVISDGHTGPPSPSELVNDQWLGVSVASQGPGKKAVACAHRYIKDNAALGRCFVITQDFTATQLRPCENMPHDHFLMNFGLCQAGMSASIGQACAHRYIRDNAALGFCYTFMQSLDFDNMFIPCKRLSHTQYLQDFGLCQAGMSAIIGQDDALVIGAPGSVLWQGVIFVTNVTDQLGVSQIEIASPYTDPKQVTDREQPTPTKPYSYNGYAVTMGKFDSSRALYYVSGAPKSHNKGEIVFFKQAPGDRLKYDGAHIIQGSKAFSGYGSSLLAVDLNNDGYDDLIVGAPYYYAANRGGAFFVYLGGAKMITSDTTYTEVLSRTMGDEECEELLCEHARFGISLSKLGDINMDSYQDFAVGAPYEGNGVVYIYHGSNAAAGFNINFVQKIIASDLPIPGLVSFGYSLSGGIDLDQNGYPDLLVGAYESNTVALIRSRPIIKIIPSLSVFPTAVHLESAPLCNDSSVRPEFRNRHCVTVKMCLSYTTKPPNSIEVIPHVVYRLEAEPKRRISRVELQNSNGTLTNVLKDKPLILIPGQQACVTELALLKSQFDDRLNSMEFRFSFGLSTDSDKPDAYPGSAVQDLNLFPVLDTEGAVEGNFNYVSVNADFVMECGEDNKCHSNLQFTAKLADVKKNVTTGIHEMVISQQNNLNISLSVSNEGEPAYLTRIYIQKPSSVAYMGVTSAEDSVTCQWLKEEGGLIVCDQIGNPLRQGKTVSFTLKLSVPQSFAETPDVYNITAWVNTSSSELTPANDQHIMFLQVINKAEISLTTNVVPDNTILCMGEPREISEIKSELDIGASVKHNFIVRNNGPGIVSESYIRILFPYEVKRPNGQKGKTLLYLMRKPEIVGPYVRCNDGEIEKYINPLNIKEEIENNQNGANSSRDTVLSDDASLSGGSQSRRKREAEVRTKRAATTLVFSCHDESALCLEYRCKLGKLETTADFVKITFDARLWESTLLSDYRKVAEVQIESWGEITIPSSLKITQDLSDDKKRAVTRAVPDFKESSGQPVQWWIILVSVLVGLIVLLVVIFVLYKLGFFRRKRMEDMQMYKAEKKQQPMLRDDYEDDAT